MNARLRKEFALLAPTFWLALALAVVPALVWPAIFGWHAEFDANDSLGLIGLCYSVGVVLLSVAAFGREYNHRTIGLLLSQPIGRGRIWLEKAAVLGVAALLLLLALRLSAMIAGALYPGIQLHATGALAMWIMISVLAGALWTTVFFRNAVAALWFTLITPMALLAIIELAVGGWGDAESEARIASIRQVVLGIYSGVAIILSWWLFLRTEDIPRFGREITLRLGWSSEPAATARISGRTPATPFVALMRKELHLHQIPLMVFASGAVVLAILALGIRLFGEAHASRQQYDWLTLGWGLMVCLISPLIGSLAIAEERKLGTADAQQCLPISRGRQFAIKWLVAHALGVALGCIGAGALAWVLARVGGPGGGFGGMETSFWWMVFVYSLAGVTLGLYGSSLARSTLGALGITVGLGMLVAGIWWLAYVPWFFEAQFRFYDRYAPAVVRHLWGPKLYLIFSAPVWVIYLWRMSFVNFGVASSPGRMWRRNISTLLIVLGSVCAVTGMTYNRAWELVERIEPRQSVPRLAPSADVTLRAAAVNKALVVLPDGRLQLYAAEPIGPGPINTVPWKNMPVIELGSNWTTVSCAAAGDRGGAGIKSDGSLWRIFRKWGRRFETGTMRVGSESDWRAVASSGDRFLAINSQGTLWTGYFFTTRTNRNTWIETNSTPSQIGTDSDWSQIFAIDDSRSVGVKRDGSTWAWGDWSRGNHAASEMANEPTRLPAAFDGPWLSLSGGWIRVVAVRADGSLWLWDGPVIATNKVVPVRVGTDSDWKSAATGWGWDVFCALKSDGTLWKFNAPLNSVRIMRLGRPERLSKYSTWLCLSGNADSVVALARDGTLCIWNEEYGIYSPYLDYSLLAPTRKPLFLGNVFAAKK